MKTITFYSYKGGVGRTLALSNMAKRLNEFGKKVFIIDFDLEAPGLHYKFKDFIRYDKIKYGLTDYIYEYITNNNIETDLKKYIRTFSVRPNSRKYIHLMCAGNNYSAGYWKKLSSINWNDLFYKENSVGIEFFINLKQNIQKQYNPDYLLIDSRTGFTEISAITMTILADEVLVFSANNIENIEGSKQIIKSIQKTPSLTGETIKTHFVLTRIPAGISPEDKIVKNKIISQVEYQLNSDNAPGEKVVEKVFVIHTDRELEIEETFKIGEEAKKGSASISQDYFNILKVIGDFTDKELNKYNDIVKSDQIYHNALKLPNNELYKNELEKALKLNSNHIAVMLALADYYASNLFLNDAISLLRKALKFEPNNSDVLGSLGYILFILFTLKKDLKYGEEGAGLLLKAIDINKQNKKVNINYEVLYYGCIKQIRKNTPENIKILLNEILKKYPDSPIVYNSLAVDYQESGNFELAYEFIYKALEKDSNNPFYKTTLAEIHARNKNFNEFYYNIEQALKDNLDIVIFFYYHKFYLRYFHDEKFLKILEKYNVLEKFNQLCDRYYELLEK